MIPADKISFIKGNFRGRYTGSLNENVVITSYKSYPITIAQNSVVSNAELVEDYSSIGSTQDCIRLDELSGINLFFDRTKCPEGINSKETLTNILITDYKLETSGKDTLNTFGELSGIFYGMRVPPSVKQVIKENAVVEKTVKTKDTFNAATYNIAEKDEIPPSDKKENKVGRYMLRIAQLLGLLFLLSLALRKCNSCNLPDDIPEQTIDSISKEHSDAINFDNSDASITVNDWDRPDNDRITIKLNNETIASDMLIKSAPQTIYLDHLNKGDNLLEIIPTDFGLGDVTATVELSDSKNTFRFECDIKKGQTVKKTIRVK